MLAASRNRKGSLSEIITEQMVGRTLDRALVVEANPCDLTNARICLMEQGYVNIDIAISLRQAFEQVKKHNYQLLLVDYFLPDGDGLELMNWMDDDCEVIMLAGHVVQGRKSVYTDIPNRLTAPAEAFAM